MSNGWTPQLDEHHQAVLNVVELLVNTVTLWHSNTIMISQPSTSTLVTADGSLLYQALSQPTPPRYAPPPHRSMSHSQQRVVRRDTFQQDRDDWQLIQPIYAAKKQSALTSPVDRNVLSIVNSLAADREERVRRESLSVDGFALNAIVQSSQSSSNDSTDAVGDGEGTMFTARVLADDATGEALTNVPDPYDFHHVLFGEAEENGEDKHVANEKYTTVSSKAPRMVVIVKRAMALANNFYQAGQRKKAKMIVSSADSLASEPEQEQITTAKGLLAACNLGQVQYPTLVTPSFVNNILNILRDGAIALATLVPTHVEGMKGADDISSPILTDSRIYVIMSDLVDEMRAAWITIVDRPNVLRMFIDGLITHLDASLGAVFLIILLIMKTRVPALYTMGGCDRRQTSRRLAEEWDSFMAFLFLDPFFRHVHCLSSTVDMHVKHQASATHHVHYICVRPPFNASHTPYSHPFETIGDAFANGVPKDCYTNVTLKTKDVNSTEKHQHRALKNYMRAMVRQIKAAIQTVREQARLAVNQLPLYIVLVGYDVASQMCVMAAREVEGGVNCIVHVAPPLEHVDGLMMTIDSVLATDECNPASTLPNEHVAAHLFITGQSGVNTSQLNLYRTKVMRVMTGCVEVAGADCTLRHTAYDLYQLGVTPYAVGECLLETTAMFVDHTVKHGNRVRPPLAIAYESPPSKRLNKRTPSTRVSLSTTSGPPLKMTREELDDTTFDPATILDFPLEPIPSRPPPPHRVQSKPHSHVQLPVTHPAMSTPQAHFHQQQQQYAQQANAVEGLPASVSSSTHRSRPPANNRMTAVDKAYQLASSQFGCARVMPQQEAKKLKEKTLTEPLPKMKNSTQSSRGNYRPTNAQVVANNTHKRSGTVFMDSPPVAVATLGGPRPQQPGVVRAPYQQQPVRKGRGGGGVMGNRRGRPPCDETNMQPFYGGDNAPIRGRHAANLSAQHASSPLNRQQRHSATNNVPYNRNVHRVMYSNTTGTVRQPQPLGRPPKPQPPRFVVMQENMSQPPVSMQMQHMQQPSSSQPPPNAKL